jgi:hypothetical protein
MLLDIPRLLLMGRSSAQDKNHKKHQCGPDHDHSDPQGRNAVGFLLSRCGRRDFLGG